MKKLMFCFLFVFAIVVVGIFPAQASAPYGHYIMAKRVIGGIQGGVRPAPQELKDALDDPDCQRAFCGGSVAPDISEEKSHYNNTGDLAQSMLTKAQAELKKAKKSGDPDAIKKANVDLAFSYGWYTHCASDLNVHPKVNAITGDCFDYKGIGGKLAHGGVEVQLDYFLWKNYSKEGEDYDVSVPYDFLSKCIDVPPGELKWNMAKLSAKVQGAAAWEYKVTLTNEEMSKAWKDVITNSYTECFDFINDQKKMQNWDLDCGKISTDEFRVLREAIIEANGGKLPDDWGKNYMNYYEKTKDLVKKAVAAEKGTQAQTGEDKTKPTGSNEVKTVDFHLRAFPKVHDVPNEADKYNIEKWRDESIASLNKQMEEDPDRAANRDACGKIPRENKEMTCAKCGFAGVHWWIEPSWSCPSCEYCTMPQDVKRSDGKTYREFAAERMKIYQDEIEEIQKTAQDALSK